MAKIDSTATSDTLLVTADSLEAVAPTEVRQGIVVERPNKPLAPTPRADSASVNSWFLGFIILVFCIVCIRYKNNSKYYKFLINDLIDPRERNSIFDFTIRENSFLFFTNLLNAISLGLIIYEIVTLIHPSSSSLHSALVAMIGIGIYYCVVPLILRGVGEVFSDETKAKIWTKGFFSTGAILSLPLFFISMTALFYPGSRYAMIGIAAFFYLIIKFLYMRKGMMLFYSSPSSWVLMFYYIIGLELVPLLLVAYAIVYF